jgi:hypothetical protein
MYSLPNDGVSLRRNPTRTSSGSSSNPPFEADFDRVAIYALIGAPKHAAKQINARTWSSKIGNNIDIEHTLRGLEGPFYGNVVKILKRPKTS